MFALLGKRKMILFPLLYLVAFLLAFSLGIEGLLMQLWFPSSIPLLFIEVQAGLPPGKLAGGDSFFFPILIGAIPYFLIGLIWDLIASYFRNKPFNTE